MVVDWDSCDWAAVNSWVSWEVGKCAMMCVIPMCDGSDWTCDAADDVVETGTYNA